MALSQITIDLTPSLEERLGVWQKATSGDVTVLMTAVLEEYFETWEDNANFVELALDEADISAAETAHRLTHKEVFAKLRERVVERHDL